VSGDRRVVLGETPTTLESLILITSKEVYIRSITIIMPLLKSYSMAL